MLACLFKSKKYVLSSVLVAGVFALYGCSAQPEGDGKPALSCGKPVMPDVNFVIERLHNGADSTLTCGSFRGDLPGPELIQFRIYELVQPGGNLPGSTGSSDDSGGSGGGEGSASGLQSGQAIKVPKAGIAFYPFLGSHLVGSAVRTAAEFQQDPSQCVAGQESPNCVISPYQYLGIVTPSSEWCSDSTGVMSYEFWMSCNGAAAEFEASVVSGAIKPDSGYSFSVSTADE